MIFNNIYESVEASLLRYCNHIITTNSLASEFQPFNFDTHVTHNKLPDKGLVGIAELAMSNNKEDHEVTVSLLVSTLNTDVDLKKLRKVVNLIYSDLIPGSKLQVVNPTTGAHVGYLTVMAGVSVLPIMGTKSRSIQPIPVSFSFAVLPQP